MTLPPTLPGVPTRTIVEALAYINWTVLTGLAVGCFAAVVGLRLLTDATRGYLAFSALLAAVLGGLAFLAEGAFADVPPTAGVSLDPVLDTVRHALLGTFVVLALLVTGSIVVRRPAPVLALAGVAVGVASLVAAAIGWAGLAPAGVPAALQFLALAAADGGALAALVLGHWYLVTPRLSERPLVLLSRALLVVVGLQAVLYATWLVTGANAGLPPLQPLVGEAALFVWFRFIVGIGLPLGVTWAAWQTARLRSMESATGLLYIDLALIASGSILAAGLWFGTGLLL
jgi:hypothetical protein